MWVTPWLRTRDWLKRSSATRPPNLRWLLMSGVNISQTPSGLGVENPVPDYLAIRQALHPDVLDVTIAEAFRHPLLGLVRRKLGVHWVVAVIALLRSRRYAAILATGEDVGLCLALLARVLPRRPRILLICHNMTTPRRAFFLRRLRVGAAIARFQCLSETQARTLARRYAIPADRIQVVYWHVDHNFFRPDRTAAVRNQICSAGMASRDYATLLQATRGLDIDVRIAADSPWFRQRLNISASDLSERVEMRSYGSYAALRQLYAESLFVVVPLLDVDFSAGYTVILEAMAMGKAVIVSRIKQRDDFVVDGWNGFYVAPGDPAGLRQRIQFLLGNPDEARRLGANGRKVVEERFTIPHYVAMVQQALEEAGVPVAAPVGSRYEAGGMT
jgi:glycosyltransferase involved in cell wall biosynthesis